MSWIKVAVKMRTFNLDNEVAGVINTHPAEIQAKQKEQWKEGKDKTGNIIGRYRSRKYAEAKYGMNSAAGFGNVDLSLTGRFKSKLRIEAVNGVVWTRSDDSKYDKLSQKYPNAMGLNKGKIVEFQGETILPELSDAFLQKVLQ